MKVLIVDDEVLLRKSLSRVLKAQTDTVFEAADGTQGLELWRQEDPDLVFLDVLMPGLTGPQVLQQIGRDRRAKVVLMSAFAGESERAETASGVDLFLPKPFEDIFEVVAKAKGLLK